MPLHPEWQLRLLGVPRLGRADRDAVALDRRAAALLAYLALEGEAPRAHLAALLYPGSGAATARNNLVHVLRRLRQAAGGGLITGGEGAGLALGADAAVDARAALAGEAEGAGLLLEGLDFSDLPEFEEWLMAWRERLLDRQRRALLDQAGRLEALGDLEAAVAVVQRLLDLDLLDEALWRRLMALHARAGHRSAALAAYGRLAGELRRELGLGAEPQPETADLAREITGGEAVALSPAGGPRPLPLGLLRPPVLVGREREWAQIEASFRAGRAVALHGESGIGKSRLLHDLVRATPGALLFEGRLADADVPYGSTVRLFRQVLRERPGLTVAPWVRRELARLLPEWGETPPPGTSDEERARFHRAQAEFLRAALGEGVTLFAWDDTHLLDEASREALPVIWMELGWGSADAPFRLIWATRPVGTARTDDPLLRPRAVTTLDLGPLGPDAVEALLRSLGIPHLAPRARVLERHAGGNPQLLLETVRHLLETGQLREDGPLTLVLPREVSAVVADRLARLSPGALQVARAGAILQSDFHPELLAEVLGVPLISVAATWEELEVAHVMRGERFSHDLVYEAVLAGLPVHLRALLHRSAARVLTRRGAPAARIAPHWRAGSEPLRAAGEYLRAADAARSAYRFREAAAWSGEAATLYEKAQAAERAFGALVQHAEDLRELTLTARLREVARRLEALAATPHQRAWALAAWIHPLLEDGELDGLARVAHSGIAAAAEVRDDRLAARFQEALAGVFLLRGELAAARTPLGTLLTLGTTLPDPVTEATAHEGLGLAWAADDPGRAAGHYDEAARIHRAGGDRVGEASVLNKRAPLLFALGDAVGALRTAEAAAERLAGVDGATNLKLINAHERFAAAFAQEEYTRAQAVLREGLAHEEAQFAGWGSVLQAEWALLHARLGDAAGARPALDVALACEKVPENKRHIILLARVVVLALLGEDARGAAHALVRHSERLGLPLVRSGALVARAAVSPPAEALPLLDIGLTLAEAHGFQGLRRAALVHRAAAHLALGRVEAARADVERALTLASAYALQVPSAEVLRVHARVLQAADDALAPAVQAAYVASVQATARWRVPVGHQGSYLQLMLPP